MEALPNSPNSFVFHGRLRGDTNANSPSLQCLVLLVSFVTVQSIGALCPDKSKISVTESSADGPTVPWNCPSHSTTVSPPPKSALYLLWSCSVPSVNEDSALVTSDPFRCNQTAGAAEALATATTPSASTAKKAAPSTCIFFF